MNDIVKLEAQALDAWMKNANVLSDSDLLPKEYRGKPANVLLAIQTGAPLGFGVIESINGIHIINGKPTMSADLVQAAVRKAGHRLRVTGDDTFAEASIVRADDPDFEFKVRWDMERAKSAGLTSNPTWKNYPAAMLRSRAITEVARMGASDALHGVIYTPEELGHVEATESPQAAPEPPPVPVASVDWANAADACASKELLRDVWAEAQAKGELHVEIEPGVTVKDYLGAAAKRIDNPVADESTGEVIEDAEVVE